MKKALTGAIALLSLCALTATAQNIEHQVVVSQFAQWKLAGQQSLVAGSNTVVPFGPCQAFAGGYQFSVLAASTPVRIVDPGNPSIDETVTPTNVVVNQNSCTATLAPANAHGTPYYLVSGTAGLQEAINATALTGTFNTAILGTGFYAAGGSSAIIASVTGNANLPLVDVTFAPYVTYRWGGSSYSTNSSPAGGSAPTAAAGAAAGTSPTGPTNTGNGNSFSVALTTGTATTTGTLFTETWPASGSFAVLPNVTVRSVGNNTPASFTYSLLGLGGELKSGTYTSGITATGTTGQTCTLTSFNNSSTATATVALTGTNTIAGSTALVVTSPGTGATAAPTSATAGNGTATCSGTATVSTVLWTTNQLTVSVTTAPPTATAYTFQVSAQ